MNVTNSEALASAYRLADENRERAPWLARKKLLPRPFKDFLATRAWPWQHAPGVDYRMPRLTVELIPAPTWGINVRTQYRALWPQIRKKAIAENGTRCASCHNPPHKIFHVHEVFEYDEVLQVQKLVGFQVLCEDCHAVKHAGRTIAKDPHYGRFNVLQALVEVNKWTWEQARDHLERAFIIWQARSLLKNWKVDLSYAQEYLAQAQEREKEVT